MRRILTALAVIVGGHMILRAVAEPVVIDVTDPTTYRDDWGGPSLAGVLVVHCGPGVVSALAFTRWHRSRRALRAGRP